MNNVLYTPKARYCELRENKWTKKLNGQACFSNLYCSYSHDTKPSDEVVYFCPIDVNLSKEIVEFYLDFLTKLLNKKLFKFKFGRSVKNPTVIFKLTTKKLKRPTALLYLTAFRYINEFPEIVLKLYKASKKVKKDDEDADEKLFRIFQDIHDSCQKKNFLKKYNNLSGHGLIYLRTYMNEVYDPLTIEEFKTNLKEQKKEAVQSFFKKIKNKVDAPA